jgi:HK97 family phage prohead protease
MNELRFSPGALAVETRAGKDAPELVGYGAVFERLSQNLGGFVEVVDPAAFTTTLASGRNVLGAVNHDLSQLLGTTDSGTLELGVDVTGLRYGMLLDLEDPDAQRAAAKVRTGKLKGSSFSFTTRDDSWGTTESGFPLRRLLAVELHELGPVASPAYLDTEEAGAAVALRSLASFVDLPLDQVTQAARSGALTDLILRDLPGLERAVVDDPVPPAPRATQAGETSRAPRLPSSR